VKNRREEREIIGLKACISYEMASPAHNVKSKWTE